MRKRMLVILAVATAVGVASAFVIGTPAGAGDGGREFSLRLSGADEVEPVNLHGDADNGSVVLTINPGQQTVCWQFGELTLTAGEALPFAAHIHEAPVGVAGPVVVPLFLPPDPATPDVPTPPTAYPTDKQCVPNVDRSLIVDMFRNPSAYYVNLHNTQHQTGVVRAQLDQ
jgi:hypothetical protein